MRHEARQVPSWLIFDVRRRPSHRTQDTRQSMIDLRKVHEIERFDLASRTSLSWQSVQPALANLGFTFMDDFAELMRSDRSQPWQSASVASCTFFAEGKQVYPDDSDFDLIRFSVLVATLPEEQARSAIHLLHLVAEQLSLPVTYAGSSVTRDACLALVKDWHADILAEIGDVAGSESVRILVLMEYEKKRV
jgi:hypothetical protein